MGGLGKPAVDDESSDPLLSATSWMMLSLIGKEVWIGAQLGATVATTGDWL
jgi:hypothetical protein